MEDKIKKTIIPEKFDLSLSIEYEKGDNEKFNKILKIDEECCLNPEDYDNVEYICRYQDFFIFLVYDDDDDREEDGVIYITHKKNLKKNIIEINGKKYQEVIDEDE